MIARQPRVQGRRFPRLVTLAWASVLLVAAGCPSDGSLGPAAQTETTTVPTASIVSTFNPEEYATTYRVEITPSRMAGDVNAIWSEPGCGYMQLDGVPGAPANAKLAMRWFHPHQLGLVEGVTNVCPEETDHKMVEVVADLDWLASGQNVVLRSRCSLKTSQTSNADCSPFVDDSDRAGL